MTKKKLLLFCSIAVTTNIGCNTIAFADSAVEETASCSQYTSAPFNQSYFIVLISVSNNLKAENNQLLCEATTSVQNGYMAKITMELQQYDKDWNTIKTWTATESEFAFLDRNRYVDSGFSYRLKLTHQGLKNNSIVDTFTDYSNIIYVG